MLLAAPCELDLLMLNQYYDFHLWVSNFIEQVAEGV